MTTNNIQNISVKPVSSFYRWLVVMTASLLFFYTFIQINMLNSVSSMLMKDFSISAEKFGTLSALYFYGNFFLVFPAGLLLDRFSTKKIILIAMSLCVITMFGFSCSHSLWTAGINRFFSGVAGAFAFLSCIRLASRWFPPKQMALASGFVVTMAMIGGIVAQTPIEMLSEVYGWRVTMMLFGCLGVLVFILMLIIIRDWPKNALHSEEDSKAGIASIGFWRSIRIVVCNRFNWFGGIYTSLMNLPVFLLGALWGSLYLVKADQLSNQQASYVIAMIFLGTIIGSPLAGWISDKIERRVFPMVIGAIISLLLVFVVIYVPHLSLITLLILFFLLGLITSTQILSYPLIAELNSPLVTGSAISVVSLIIMASGFVFQPFFGYLMDLHWNHLIVNNVPIYSIQDFKIAMAIFPTAFAISLMISLLLKETRCRAQKN